MSYQPSCPACGYLDGEGHSKECTHGRVLQDVAKRELDAAKREFAEPDAVDYTRCECCAKSYEQGHRDGFQAGFLQGVKDGGS